MSHVHRRDVLVRPYRNGASLQYSAPTELIRRSDCGCTVNKIIGTRRTPVLPRCAGQVHPERNILGLRYKEAYLLRPLECNLMQLRVEGLGSFPN
jgi:hypothetical protein